MPHSVVRLPLERLDDVVEVFFEAFRDYPVMRFTVGDEGDVAARVNRLVRLFVTRRVARGGPMYGVDIDGRLAGAILLTLPREAPPGPEVAEISAAAWRELGEDARLRYDAYAAASNFFAGTAPHLHLNMIGARHEHKGSGLGRVLLDYVRRLAEDDPESAGVSLTTENPRNVGLYQHFGYEVVGHAQVLNYETWGLFLPVR